MCYLGVPSAWHRPDPALPSGMTRKWALQSKEQETGVELKSKCGESIPLCPHPLMAGSLKAQEQIKTRSDFPLRKTLIINLVHFSLGT